MSQYIDLVPFSRENEVDSYFNAFEHNYFKIYCYEELWVKAQEVRAQVSTDES